MEIAVSPTFLQSRGQRDVLSKSSSLMVVDEGLLQELEPLRRVDVETMSEETADCRMMDGFRHKTEVYESAGYDV
jgi:hypothetical protein